MPAELPLIESCDGCGACCFEQESPPGYAMLLSSPQLMDDPGPFQDDVARLRSLPAAALAELQAYVRRLVAGVQSDNPACIWLDPSTLKCRYYDHRPSICRDLDLGSEACRDWRRTYDVDG